MKYLKAATVIAFAYNLAACGINLGSDCVIICF